MKCPYCQHELLCNYDEWTVLNNDLDQFGKSVVECSKCHQWYCVRCEDEDDPFVTGTYSETVNKKEET